VSYKPTIQDGAGKKHHVPLSVLIQKRLQLYAHGEYGQPRTPSIHSLFGFSSLQEYIQLAHLTNTKPMINKKTLRIIMTNFLILQNISYLMVGYVGRLGT